jgi:hypothetical protein
MRQNFAGNGKVMNYYIPYKAKLLKNFDKIANRSRGYVVARYGEKIADSLSRKAKQHYEQLIPQIPHIDRLPVLNVFLRISALELSVFRAMKEHGKSAPLYQA